MSEQRRAMCCELAEVDQLIAELQTALIAYKTNTQPEWEQVAEVRDIEQRLRALLGRAMRDV